MYQRLRTLRKEHQLTQTQIASVLKMSQTGYSKYETGENDIPTSVLIRLAAYYRTSVDYLLGITDNTLPAGDLSEILVENVRHIRETPDPEDIDQSTCDNI